MCKELENYDFRNHYICSFSLKPDDLEQWRAYAKNGAGFCIGFDTKEKTRYPHFVISNIWQYSKVIYDDNLKKWILHSIIFKYFHEYKKDQIDGFDNRYDDDYIMELTSSLAYLFINFKNSNFSNEKEFRMIYTERNPLRLFQKKQFRNCNNVLVPYLRTDKTQLKDDTGKELEVDLLPISEIIVDPAASQEEKVLSIKYFLEEIGYSPEIVRTSQIPYRG